MTGSIVLGVLCLSRWIISQHLDHQYHYVPDQMSWTQAQSYCRHNYTDLVSVGNAEEIPQMVNLSSAVFWTGLFSQVNWTWSDGNTQTGPYNHDWASLKYVSSHRWCLNIDGGGTLHFDNCSEENPFICYHGTRLNPEFELVNEPMSWSNAQSYCRRNYTDLVTVSEDSHHQEVLKLVQSRNQVWLGLSGNLNLSWSGGSSSDRLFWEYAYFIDLDSPVTCGLIDMFYRSLLLYPCDGMFPFICYSSSAPPTAVRMQVVKLRMKLDDDSVDLNDPDVQAHMLEKLQDRLKEKGVRGVSLKWREQSDGKVFHKKERKPEL